MKKSGTFFKEPGVVLISGLGQQDNTADTGEPGSISNTNQPFLGKLQRKMMPQTLAKKRQLILAKSKQRRHERTAHPMRLTSCIFKSEVTKLTAHPDNVFRWSGRRWPWRSPSSECLQETAGAQACSSEGELLNTFDVTNMMKIIAPGSLGESLGHAGPGSLHTNPQPSKAQFLN